MGREAPAPAGRRIRGLTAAVRGTAVAAALGLALAGGPAPARADEEIPPAVRALEADDAGARDAAAAALEASAEADDLVVMWLRDTDRRSRLTPPALRALAVLAGRRKLPLANAGLRAIVRDRTLPADVRAAAATSLGTNGSLVDVAALGDALADVPDACSRALATIGGESALAALRRGCEGLSPTPPEALAAAVRLGDRSGLGELIEGLDDASRRDRVHELLQWATGRDLPADASAWRELAARLDLADTFAAADIALGEAEVKRQADVVRAGGPEGAAAEARLAALLADETAAPAARARAAIAIGVAGVRTRNDLLLEACRNGQPGDVRFAAAGALARVGDLSCAVPLASMLVHDEDRDRLLAKRSPRREYVPVDPEMVRCLARLRLPGGVLALLDDLAGDYRSGLQRDAVRALGEYSGGDEFGFDTDAAKAERLAAVDRMREWWTDARTTLGVAPPADAPGREAFRAHVADLVHKLGEFKFLYQLRAKRALMIVAEGAHDQIVAALDDPVLLVRTGAAEVMEGTALRAFAAPLASRIAKEPNPAARMRFLWALEKCARPLADGTPTAGPEVRDAVRAALDDRVLDVRIAAVRALGVVGEASDADRIRAARAEARNASDAFRAATAGALLRWKDLSGLPDLLAEMRCDDVARRADAARLVRRAGIDVAGYDPDAAPEKREEAVRAIEASVPEGRRR